MADVRASLEGLLGHIPSSAFVLASGIVIFLSVLVLLSLMRRGNGKAPPTLSTIPVIGGVLKFMEGPLKLVKEGYEKHGDVFTVNVFHKKITFLIGPEVSNHFFKAPETDLSQKEVYQYSVPTFGKGVVFDVDYSVRQEQFRMFADSLRSSKLRDYVKMMVMEAESFFGKWGDEGEVDLKEELAKLIIMTASRTLLGREVREQMFEQVSDLFHTLDLGMLPISVILPTIPIPAHLRRNQARKQLGAVFRTIIANRRANGVRENDALQAFIDARYKNPNRPTTDEEITGLLIAALFAGQHTSSITSTWTGFYLHTGDKKFLPDVLAEQQRVMAKHGDNLDFDILQEMDYLHRAIKEVLRLQPPLIMLLRYVRNDFSVTNRTGKSYVVPKGHIVATSPSFAHRLPHIYKRVDEFDPDRFGPGREEDKKGGAFSYIGFGGGRHGCMGETFAYMQIKTIWSILLRNFELETVSPFPEPDLESMVVGPKGECRVRYKRRKLSAV